VVSSHFVHVGAYLIGHGTGVNGDKVVSERCLVQAGGDIQPDVAGTPTLNSCLLGLVRTLFSPLLVGPLKFSHLVVVGAALGEECRSERSYDANEGNN
jgi:hypothetical protein